MLRGVCSGRSCRASCRFFSRKGQSSMEAAMLVTVMVIAFTIFLAASSDKLVETKQKRDKDLINDVSSVIETELSLAAASENGYYRKFELPPNLDGRPFEVSISGAGSLSSEHSEVTLKYGNGYLDGFEKVIVFPKSINGTRMCSGINVLEKADGIVNVSCTCITGYKDLDGDGFTDSLGADGVKDFCGVEAITDKNYQAHPSAINDCDDNNRDKWQFLPCFQDKDDDSYTVGSQVQACVGSDCHSPVGYRESQSQFNGADDCSDDPVADSQAGLKWRLRFRDSDSDSYGSSTIACVGNDAGYSDNNVDCDDSDSRKFVLRTCYDNHDLDVAGGPSAVSLCTNNDCSYPAGLTYLNGNDCNPDDGSVWQILTGYQDNDKDGYTSPPISVCSGSSLPSGYISTPTTPYDCNDNDINLIFYCSDSDLISLNGDWTFTRDKQVTPKGVVTSHTAAIIKNLRIGIGDAVISTEVITDGKSEAGLCELSISDGHGYCVTPVNSGDSSGDSIAVKYFSGSPGFNLYTISTARLPARLDYTNPITIVVQFQSPTIGSNVYFIKGKVYNSGQPEPRDWQVTQQYSDNSAVYIGFDAYNGNPLFYNTKRIS
ncbi:hypothetical protein HYY72_00135 [Candidatus Woesearchaeota archaeon]|nr:hypothetical protein [Candidatus Woesearchaeota archaeon]